jgi:hypothetical protein
MLIIFSIILPGELTSPECRSQKEFHTSFVNVFHEFKYLGPTVKNLKFDSGVRWRQ